MADSVPRQPHERYSPWGGMTDAEASSRLRNYPAGEAPSDELGKALSHTLRDVAPQKVGVPALEHFVGYGDEHPAVTVIRALFEDANQDGERKPSHFDDPDFRASALALGQRLVQEYTPQTPQPTMGGPHGE